MNIPEPNNFIEEIVADNIREGLHDGRVHTRFPPEPNGYLHIGHSKSIVVNFGIAEKYGGKCNLRFDDTNPTTEKTQYVDNIKKDIQWLGYQWDGEYYASDYFQQFYDFAVALIQKGLAYVDDSSVEQINEMRGTTYEPGKDSPYRNRSIDENLQLLEEMRQGKYPDGAKVLRAKIDMAHPNVHMRDPIMYRIKHVPHHRTGEDWCIYPMYDFAHGQSDSIERVTHSICTLEFVPHRELYDWFIEKLEIFPSRQYEFARLNLSYVLMSKRKLLKLIEGGYVEGWEDPRMPTISAMRRRGYPPEALREFAKSVGVQKRENIIELSHLEHYVRKELNAKSWRLMAVLDPVKLIIENYSGSEIVTATNNPEDDNAGSREMSFSGELWIERSDFMENPPKKYFRLSPGGMVRLKFGYIIECTRVEKDAYGNITTIYAKYFPESRSGNDTSGLKVRGTIHWVDAHTAENIRVHDFDLLFTDRDPAAYDGDIEDILTPDSYRINDKVMCEPAVLRDDIPYIQFMRNGYYKKDVYSEDGRDFINTVSLKDSWAKEQNKKTKK